MTEKKDYGILRDNMPVHGDRIDRIENVVGVGTPDINFCIEGVEGWIELKSPREPKRASTRLFGSNHKLSQDQMNWFLKQEKAGGNGFVLIATDKRWMLIEGWYADDVNKMTLAELIIISRWTAPKPITRREWKKLREVLIK
jgi:hypothetical protein